MLRILLPILLLAPLSAADPLDIPRVDGIAIDGSGEDWGERGHRISALSWTTQWGPLPRALPDPADQSVGLRLGWDDHGLLLRAELRDDRWHAADQDGALYTRDSLELFLAAADGTGLYQPVIGPDAGAAHPVARCFVHQRAGRDITVEWKMSGQGGRRLIEARLPWSALPVVAQAGALCSFQVLHNDWDGPESICRAAWAVPGEVAGKGRRLLRLAAAPGPASDTAISLAPERWRRLRVLVEAPSARVGAAVVLRLGDDELGRARLAAEADRAVASFTVPLPVSGSALAGLRASLGDAVLDLPGLGDLDGDRRKALERLELDTAWVFTGAAFPSVDFREANLADDITGGYELRTRWFDAAGQPCTVPLATGRYGALVEVSGGDGALRLRRYLTCYRVSAWQEDYRTWMFGVPGWAGLPTALPEGLGSLPARGEIQVGRVLRTAFVRQANAARLLAARDEGIDPMLAEQADRAWWWRVRRDLTLFADMPYAEFLPEGYEQDAQRRWPLVVCLHGSGGSQQGDVAKLATRQAVALARRSPGFPALVLQPANVEEYQPFRGEGLWNEAALDDLLDRYLAQRRVDPTRIVLVGFSRGAIATWMWSAVRPERFAAIAAVGFRGDGELAYRYRGLPVHLVFGDADQLTPPDEMAAMQTALAAQGEAVLTRYPGTDHPGAEAKAFADRTVIDWLLGHQRGVQAP
jgi:dienelactone hydrolase